jgi:hypothetical protein
MLLRENFNIKLEIDNITWSETIQKAEFNAIDKSMKIRIRFTTV